MALRKIIEYPEPLLRLKAKKVDVFNDELKILVEDMAETMWDAPGIGLAAPQVAQSVRVIVVDITEPGEEKQHMALINPEITAQRQPMGIPRPSTIRYVSTINMAAATNVVYLNAPAGSPPWKTLMENTPTNELSSPAITIRSGMDI